MLGAIVIAACAAMVALGLLLIVRQPARRAALHPVVAAVIAGAVAGVLGAGAGGRLVMRLLALTSPDARRALTEAQAIVGEITAGGTLGLIVFGGLPAGLLTGALYALARPLLPAGRAGGVLLGLVTLVIFGALIDPLRGDNIDFSLLGPGWLSVLAFTALAAFTGMLVAAVAERLSAPPIARARVRRGGRVALGVVVLVALPVFGAAVVDILGG